MGRSFLFDLDHNPIEPEQLEAVLRDPRRCVGRDTVDDHWLVSTVFLGVDYNHSGYGVPILYETMVFGPESWDDEYLDRYATREAAERGHRQTVEMVRVLAGVSPRPPSSDSPQSP